MIRTAVMTCWSAPMRRGLSGGAALWSLAALCAREHFDRLVLCADPLGAEWMLRDLAIPFDEVIPLALSDSYAPLWCLGKIVAFQTMAQRGETFVHIDGDACLLRPLPDRLLTARVLAEMPEEWAPDQALMSTLVLPPKWMRALRGGADRMWNCGVFGGTDTQRIAAWASLALSVAKVNARRWAGVTCQVEACMMLEQWSLARMFRDDEVTTLFDSPEVSDAAAQGAGYVHLKGAAKHRAPWRRRVERELSARFPAQALRLGLDQTLAA